ncbi:putative ABC transport system ATP-binding protein [Deinococcus metalli]|uniref:Peptide ABC transporter ATP-binding protein n=1 Tax=Deinococcus metalli TaxID=1141878 RepID=A0A7W8NTY0_9DEIO|nr:ABC transporter ATP-binding protein [Deinococcus metalli]MBB5378712.1 putative ABC transport system ATP-binding protein [Deinococcus metalli]GHF60494.1 peptide ABC transporter ATP-binding protein [Deinococcus metalli]
MTLNEDHPAVPLASLRSVSRQYGDLSVLQDVTLDLHAGEFVSVTGPSGSGKSTLLSVLGLLERPSRGQVCLHGQDAWTLPDRAQSRLRGEMLGFVFQGFHLLPELSALDNVARPLRWAGVTRVRARERALHALEAVGLGARAGHRPAQLSGGEQQRVAIARAIVREPALLLADEPTGNLPQAMWGEILDLFADLHARGHTVVVVTHDPLVAARAQRHVVLKDGRVVEDGRR